MIRGTALATALASLTIACGAPAREELPVTKPPIEIEIGRFDPNANLAITTEQVAFPVEGHRVPGTLVRPQSGVWPAVVLLAGSGPTDRDWNSPLLAGKNGAGKLLAEALAKHGAVVLRFDKAGVGDNKLAHDQVTLDTYVAEARGAMTLLRGRTDVDAAHLFLAGHSEGGLHAIRTALAEGGRIAGVILLSSPGRAMKEIAAVQIAAQLDLAAAAGQLSAEVAKAQAKKVREALEDLADGKPVDPVAVSPIPGIQAVIAAFADPSVAKLAADLLGFDPAEAITKLHVPIFIFNGLKDVQVDPQLDADALAQKVHDAGGDATLFLGPDANHVLIHEIRPLAALRKDPAAAQANYNAAESVIDATSLSAIANWIAAHDAAAAAK